MFFSELFKKLELDLSKPMPEEEQNRILDSIRPMSPSDRPLVLEGYNPQGCNGYVQKSSRDDLKDFNLNTTPIWNAYNQHNLPGSVNPSLDNTALFFDQIPHAAREKFSSYETIVQLGIGLGRYYIDQNLTETKNIIGYDYSMIAANFIQKEGMRARLLDLNKINLDQLDYLPQLEEDLSEPCAVVIIRTLEYLDNSAITLLMFALMNKMKPGSAFYFETLHTGEVEPERNDLPVHYIHSFFGARTDMATCYHDDTIQPEDAYSGPEAQTERLVVYKR
ncbi:MAG: hypothetical protein P1U36_00005 [Legionellaceae bacterium]|nr:hypothetical protein [Legionellaceae bacterium]